MVVSTVKNGKDRLRKGNRPRQTDGKRLAASLGPRDPKRIARAV